MADFGTHSSAEWILYFNGVQIPAQQVTVSTQGDSIPQANIVLPPDITMRRIGAEDRVRATVFYCDRHFYEEPTWCLLFDGEVVDYQYTDSPRGRSLTYTAVDMVAVLTQLMPVLVTGLRSITRENFALSSATVGSVMNPFTIGLSLLKISLADGSVVTRPFEFVDNIIRLVSGEGATETNQSAVSVQWFQKWLDRTKFDRRIFPTYQKRNQQVNFGENIFPILRAVQVSEVIEVLAKEGDRIASSASYYEMIRLIFQRMYYSLTPVLAPPAAILDSKTKDILGQPIQASFGNNRSQSVLGLGQFITQPKNLFGIPPKCNVFWPSMVTSHSYVENFATQPTRTYIGEKFKFSTFVSQSALDDIVDIANTSAYPREAKINLDKLKASISSLRSEEGKPPSDGYANVDNFLVYPEEFFKGPVYNDLTAPYWFAALNDDTLSGSQLQQIYAAMEHHRTRLSRRNGSLQMAFNPYPVVSQPCVTLDNEDTNHHVYGYVTSITHTLTQNSASTSVSYSMGQTFEEFFERLSVEQVEFGDIVFNQSTNRPVQDTDVVSTPFHPIRELREKYQTLSGAEEHYQTILYQRQDVESIFNVFDVLGVVPANAGPYSQQEPEDISVRLSDSNAYAREHEGYIPKYLVKPAYQASLTDADAAMRYSARPVCTLDQYIDFHEERGVRQQPRPPEYPREGLCQTYYVRILDLVQGPGLEPEETSTGGRCSVIDVDTRRDWQSRLIQYREKVYNTERDFLA